MKKIMAVFILVMPILGGAIFIMNLNNYQKVDKNKLIGEAISLINEDERLSCFNINQDTKVINDKKNIDSDSFTWMITYQRDIKFDSYIRIGNLKTEKVDFDEYYVEFLYNNEIDKIIAYNILQSNTSKNPYITMNE